MAIIKVESDSIKGKFYEVNTVTKTCNCPFFKFNRKKCKHIVQAMEGAESQPEQEDQCCGGSVGTTKLELKNFNDQNQKAMLKKFDDWTRQRVSKNFILRDFMYSSTADFFSISNKPSDHPEQVLKSAKALAAQLLEPILEKFGRFFITYGYSSRKILDTMFPNKNQHSSNPHQWDRGTYGSEVYARIDIVPLCVLDGEVSPEEFIQWVMDNTDIDLLMFWRHSSTFCMDICPKPRRVAIEWVSMGKGEKGSNKITHRGHDYWQNVYPTLPEDKKPKFSPSVSGGSMQYF